MYRAELSTRLTAGRSFLVKLPHSAPTSQSGGKACIFVHSTYTKRYKVHFLKLNLDVHGIILIACLL